MKAKYTANWGVQIAAMIFQTRSRERLHTDGDAKLAESIFQTCSGTMQFSNMLHSVS
nr:DUF6783 domain-containing protein [uncultured Anaerobutyricum sp.]